MKFVDTNVFTRYLTGDDPAKAGPCSEFFARVERGEEAACTSEAVIAEIVYVTSSRAHHALTRLDIVRRLQPLLSLPGIAIPHRPTILRALEVYAAHAQLDFEDALTVAHMERLKIEEVLSYDRDFDAVPGVTRVEP